MLISLNRSIASDSTRSVRRHHPQIQENRLAILSALYDRLPAYIQAQNEQILSFDLQHCTLLPSSSIFDLSVVECESSVKKTGDGD